MKTIWDPAHRKRVLARLEHLSTDRKPLWGSMTCAHMIAHLADPIKTALGEKEVQPKRSPLSNPILRHLIIYWTPWPKGAPTAPEYVHSGDENLEEGMAELRNALDRFIAHGKDAPYEAHPAFGQISGKAWGRLTYRHLDHHLRQFGV
jgi:hypothetical protein